MRTVTGPLGSAAKRFNDSGIIRVDFLAAWPERGDQVGRVPCSHGGSRTGPAERVTAPPLMGGGGGGGAKAGAVKG